VSVVLTGTGNLHVRPRHPFTDPHFWRSKRLGCTNVQTPLLMFTPGVYLASPSIRLKRLLISFAAAKFPAMTLTPTLTLEFSTVPVNKQFATMADCWARAMQDFLISLYITPSTDLTY
jgi:hypothetical protein